jgi:hypothetical protein
MWVLAQVAVLQARTRAQQFALAHFRTQDNFAVLHNDCVTQDKAMVVRLAGGRELIMAPAWSREGGHAAAHSLLAPPGLGSWGCCMPAAPCPPTS